jgi:hypothetical protein
MTRLATELRNGEQSFRRIALVTLLYLISSAQAMLPVDDPDIWWRFRTGQWIAAHHAVPFQDYFSVEGIGKPWIEYSWLFELIIYGVYAAFSLPGVVYFVVSAALLITFTSHQLVRRSGLPFAAEIALVAAAMGAIKPVMTPRPWLFTIFFFAVELLVIDRVRRSGKSQLLWILPLLFIIWANLHIQFVYGLAVLGLLLAEALIVMWCQKFGVRTEIRSLSPQMVLLVLILSVISTFITPYNYRLYQQIMDYMVDTGVFSHISELHPMFFRSLDNWLVLALTIAAAFVIGWRRKWLPFPLLLFFMSTFVAFRARRDAWVLVLAALWIVGDAAHVFSHRPSQRFSRLQTVSSIISVVLSLCMLAYVRNISDAHLWAAVERRYPVGAVSFIKTHRLAGPVFNDYDWGGFLLWSLPDLPIAIDGRLNLFGDERLARVMNTWDGRSGWASDPDLIRAKLVIADKDRALTSLLRVDSRYKISFEDNLAVVFVADPAPHPR